MKAEIYNALASFNRAFEMAVEALKILQEEGLVKAEYVQAQAEILEEIRAGINAVILDKLGHREIADREHFGKMRSAQNLSPQRTRRTQRRAKTRSAHER